MQPTERFPFKFFTVNDDGTCHAFNVDLCDVCGRECEAPNAVTLHETPDRCKRGLGMRERLERLPEIAHSDALDESVCPDCNPDVEDEMAGSPFAHDAGRRP